MDHQRKTEYTDKQIYKPEYAGTTKRNRDELASVIWGGGGLWLWENRGQVGSKVYGGGGAFMHLAGGGGVQPALFWSRVEKFWKVVARSGAIGMRR